MNIQSTQIKPAHVGSISHGTLRTEDLLSAFADELESQILVNGAYFSLPQNHDERDKLNTLHGEAMDAMNEEKLHFGFFDGLRGLGINMTLEQALSCAHQGSCDDDVRHLARQAEIIDQLDAYGPEAIVESLKEVGAWNETELQDHDQNRQRAVCISACDIKENATDEEANEIVASLDNALQTFAPSYCYFGAHEGDGSDFGYWPSMEEIDELPTVENSDEAKELGEDSKSVNDHGNVTVYGADGSVILELV